MKARHLETLALQSYEAGRIKATSWKGLMPVPIPEIYLRYIAAWAEGYAARHPKMHRKLAMNHYAAGFIDTFMVPN
jgi:hypothetical protein